jgi:spermidine synthase
VKKLEQLEQARSPDGTVMHLCRRDRDYSIRVHGVELMSTRRHHSERKLAELVCRPIQSAAGAHVLIGGLGFGFTLTEALRILASDAHVVVAELVPEVVAWNRNPDYHLAGASLEDVRVEVRIDDVANVLRASPGTFDAIMLDVDNGADALTTSGNARLYRASGIAMTGAALRPGGRLAYWSDRDDPAFEAMLRRAGLTVEVTRVFAHVTAGPLHTVYVARA